MVIKIYSNISYNYHRLDDPEESLKYSDAGIEFAQLNYMMYALPLLYMRKGVAELKLGKKEHSDSLRKSIYMLDIQGNTKLKELYENVLEKKYNIKF